MAHELYEAYLEQIKKRNDDKAHNGACKIEDDFNGGYERVTASDREKERELSDNLAKRFNLSPKRFFVRPFLADGGPYYLVVEVANNNVVDVSRR